MSSDLINLIAGRIDAHYYHGEYNITCPVCGHAPKNRYDTCCSFGPAGWHCFACGAGGSVKSLAKELRIETGDYIPPAPRPKPAPRLPTWLPSAEAILAGYEHHPRRYELWQAYKPLTMQTIHDARLGVGVMPTQTGDDGYTYHPGGCSHERLIVPMIAGSRIVALRGRRLACECDKWTASVGATLDRLPLFNSSTLAPGKVVFIVENTIDALLLSQRGYAGVAIYSTSYWKDEWRDQIVRSRPEMVFIALDNDLVGNGGAWRRQEFIDAWLADPKHKGRIPEARGVYIANQLARVGCPAILYDWEAADYKADIGSLLIEESLI